MVFTEAVDFLAVILKTASPVVLLELALLEGIFLEVENQGQYAGIPAWLGGLMAQQESVRVVELPRALGVRDRSFDSWRLDHYHWSVSKGYEFHLFVVVG